MKFRISSAVQFTNDKIMAKMGRGSFDLSVRQDGEICVVKWFDKKSELLYSSKLGAETLDKYTRLKNKIGNNSTSEGAFYQSE